MLASMREGGPLGLTGIPQRPRQENDAIPKVAPKWLKHDRQVSDGSVRADRRQSQSVDLIIIHLDAHSYKMNASHHL